MFAIDNYPIAYPYYHKATDVVSALDLGFCTGAVKIAAAALVELANQ